MAQVPVADRSVMHLEHLHTLLVNCSASHQASDILELICTPRIIHTSIDVDAELTDEHIFTKAVELQQLQLLNPGTLSVSESHLSLQGDKPDYVELSLTWWSRESIWSGPHMSY